MSPITFIPKLPAEGIWRHFLKLPGHSSEVPRDHDFTLHFKLYLLWGFISVVVQMPKKKKMYLLCYTCFEIMCPDVINQ